jgi:hypothetical protein
MRGKNKCKILKQIRQQIAKENDIPLITKDCTYQGECSGTCPKCEGELQYLEQQLARRRAMGKAVTVAALSIGVMVGAAGCSGGGADLRGDVPVIVAPETTAPSEKDPDASLIPLPVDDTCTESVEVLGEFPEETEITELEGDVAYISIPEYTETAGVPPMEEGQEPSFLQIEDTTSSESGNE